MGPGHGHEPWTIREYSPGDPRKKIHWRSSAHRGRLMVRVDTMVGAGDVNIVIDSCRRFNSGGGRNATLEQMIRLAASLSARLLDDRVRVELLTHDPEFRVPPGDGLKHLTAILDALVGIRAATERDLVSLLEEMPSGASGTLVVPVGSYLYGHARLHRLLTDAASQRGVLCILFESDGDSDPASAAHWISTTGARTRIIRPLGRGEFQEEDD